MRGALNSLALILVLANCTALAAGKSIYDMDLGDLPSFETEAAASKTCGADEVVWASQDIGLFYHRNETEFASKRPGAYACQSAALKARYWDSNPFSSVRDKGRSFPLNPDLICPACS